MKHILSLDPLPSISKAYYLTHQVEKHKQILGHMTLQDKGATCAIWLYQKSIEKKDNRRFKNSVKVICSYCKKPVDHIDNCFELAGYLDWYKGSKDKIM